MLRQDRRVLDGSSSVKQARVRKSRATRAAMGRAVENLETRMLLTALPTPVHAQPVYLPKGPTAASSAATSPVISYDPVNPQHRVAFWQSNATASAGRAVQKVYVRGAYTVDGGVTWLTVPVSGNQLDPNTVSPTNGRGTAFPYAIEPQVGFDRLGNFFLTYTESTADRGSGYLMFNRFTFDSASTNAPTASLTNKAIEGWVGAVDPIYNVALAVDTTVDQFTDPTTGDSLSGATVPAGQIYLAWTLTAQAPVTGATDFASDKVQVLMSSDQGTTFGAASFVGDDTFGTPYVRPSLVVSQGTTANSANGVNIPQGLVNLVFSDVSDGTPNFNTSVLNDSFVGVSGVGGAGTFGQIDTAVKVGTVTTTGTTSFTTTIAAPLTANTLSNIEVKLGVKSGVSQSQIGHLTIALTAPNGGPTVILTQTSSVSGATLGVLNNQDIGTIFTASSFRSINGIASPAIGRYDSAESLATYFGGNAVATTGDWTLTIYDSTVETGALANLDFWNLALTYDGNAVDGTVGGVDNTVVTSDVFDSKTTFRQASVAAPVTGIGVGATIASDNTLGVGSSYAGVLYVAYVDHTNGNKNPATNTDIFLKMSYDGGFSWLDGNAFTTGLLTRINDDGPLYGATLQSTAANQTAGRSQFQPSIAVDPMTGLLAVSWIDARFDLAGRRTVNEVAASIDGGSTFSTNSYASMANVVYDVNTSMGRTANALTDDLADTTQLDAVNNGGPVADSIFGAGYRTGLIAYGGVVTPVWASNLDGGPTGTTDLTIAYGKLTFPAGPQVVYSTAGVVSQPTDSFNTATATGTPQLSVIYATFDRVVDPASVTTDSIVVTYRTPSTSGNLPGTNVAIGNAGVFFGGTIAYFVLATPQTAVGTYSYYIKPTVRDSIRFESGTNAATGTIDKLGNGLDTVVDGVAGVLPTAGNNGDAYAMPRPLASNSFNGSYFLPGFEKTSLPLIVPGPHIVATAPAGGTFSYGNSNTYVNSAAKFLDIRFDRNMNPLTITPATILGLMGPGGTISATGANAFTVQANPLGTDPDPAHPQTYRIGIPDQVLGGKLYSGQILSGQYTIQLAATIKDAMGFGVDPNLNAGLAELRDENTDSTSTDYGIGNIATGLPTTAGAFGDYPVVVPDNFTVSNVKVTLNALVTDTRLYKAELIGPNGVRVLLFSGVGSAGSHTDFTQTVFDDGAAVPISSGTSPYTGSFIPAQALTAFASNATQSKGTWLLRVTALANGASGTLGGLTLTLDRVPTVNQYGATVVNPQLPTMTGMFGDYPLTVPDSFVVTSVTALLSITTPDTRLFKAELIGPNGVDVPLFNGPGSSGQHANFSNTLFDDNATVPIANGGAPFFGSFRPTFPLSQFAANGTQAKGNWLLRITALTNGASGTLTSFGLNLGTSSPTSGVGTPEDRETVGFRVFVLDPKQVPSSSNWTAVGPASENGLSGPIGGLAVDPSDASGNTVYVGAAAGGIWKTRNFLTAEPSGPTWIPLTDLGSSGSLTIGNIALVPVNNDPSQTIVFAVTGNADEGTTGIGMLRSLDAGLTWDIIDSTDNSLHGTSVQAGSFSPISSTTRDHLFVGTYGREILVDPVRTPSGQLLIYAALSNNGAVNGGTNGGVWRSLDSGLTWTRMRAGQPTSLVVDETSATVNAQGAPTGNADILYAAFQGDGIYQSPNRGVVWNDLPGGVGRPLLRDANVVITGSTSVQTGTSTLSTAAAGRVTLARPSQTGERLKDQLYEGWLYALVSNADGSYGGLYLSKDFGQNWTNIKLGLKITKGVSEGPSLDPADFGNFDPFGGGGNSNNAMAVDPNDPSVIYIGGRGLGAHNTLYRIDTTFLSDPGAFYVKDYGVDGPAVIKNYLQPPAVVAGTGLAGPPYLTTPLGTGQGSPLTDPAINAFRQPIAPDNGDSLIYAQNVSSLLNDGTGATWTSIDSIALSNQVRRLVTVKDTLTGESRLLIGFNVGIGTGVDGATVSDPNVGKSFENVIQNIGGYQLSTFLTGSYVGGTPVTLGTRVGNLQIGEEFYGAAQPNLNAAVSFLLGGFNFTGVPQSSPDLINTGVINWPSGNTSGFGYQVAIDQTGGGHTYSYYTNYLQPYNTTFFQVDGVARTNGLPQSTTDTEFNQPSGFAVNPVNGSQIILTSNIGRVFATTTMGFNWSMIADTGDLDGHNSHAMAFGAPPVSGPTGALNDLLYVGTDGGRVYVTFTGGGGTANRWINLSRGLDGSQITSIITNPTRGSYEAYATTTAGRVYWMPDSRAANATWVNISGNIQSFTAAAFNNPNYVTTRSGSVESVAADWRYLIPDAVRGGTFPVLYAAGDGGVFRSFDRGTTWALFPAMTTDNAIQDGGVLPNATVTDLDLSLGIINSTTGNPDYTNGQNLLLASTYGRGMFAIRLAPVIIPTPTHLASQDDGPSQTDLHTTINTVTFSGQSEATVFGNSVTIHFLNVTNPNAPVELASTLTDDRGNFTVTAGGSTVFPTEGTYTLELYAVDAAGLISQPTLFTYTLDRTPPAAPTFGGITVATDSGVRDQITNNRMPTLFGTADAGSFVSLTLSYSGGTVTGTGVTDATGTWTFTPTGPLVDGVYMVTAQDLDLSGFLSPRVTYLQTFTIQTTVPGAIMAPMLLPASDTGIQDNITSINLPTLIGAAPASSTVELLQNGVLIGTTTATTAGTWSLTLVTPQPEGTATYSAVVVDTVGNTSAASPGLVVTVDTIAPITPGAPTLSINDDTGISNADKLTNIRTPHFIGTVEPSSYVELYENGALIGAAQATVSGAYSVIPNLPFADGAHTITVRNVDGAGNASSVSLTGVTITVDGTAPTVFAVDPIYGTVGQTFAGTVASYTDDYGFGSASVAWGDGNTSVATASGSPITLTGTNVFAASGVLTYYVTAFDAAGNSTTAIGHANVANPGGTTAPSLAAGISGQSVVFANYPATFTLTATDTPTLSASGFSYLVNFGDGSAPVTVLASAGNGAGVPVSKVYAAAGNYTVTLTATDRIGVTSTVTLPVTVTIAPFISSVTVNGGSPAISYNNISTVNFTLSGSGGALPTLTTADLSLIQNRLNPVSLATASFTFNTATGAGSINLDAVPLADGVYDLTINVPNGQPLSIRFYRLLGDVDGNFVVNSTDYKLASKSVGKTAGIAGYLATADVNRDGVVDKNDLKIIRSRSGHMIAAKAVKLTYKQGLRTLAVSLSAPAGGDAIVEDIILKNGDKKRGLTISQLALTGETGRFALEIVGAVGSTSATIAPGQSVTLRVYFRPLNLGKFTSAISFFPAFDGVSEQAQRFIKLTGKGKI